MAIHAVRENPSRGWSWMTIGFTTLRPLRAARAEGPFRDESAYQTSLRKASPRAGKTNDGFGVDGAGRFGDHPAR